jgi:hypothetical protein
LALPSSSPARSLPPSFRRSAPDGGIDNPFFSVSFDPKGGTLHVNRRNGTPLLVGRPVANASVGKRFISGAHYDTTLDAAAFNDRLGPGKQLRITSRDRDRTLDFEILVTLYDHLEAVTIEAFCTNASAQDLLLASLEPIRAVAGEGGVLNVPGVTHCLTNGVMY